MKLRITPTIAQTCRPISVAMQIVFALLLYFSVIFLSSCENKNTEGARLYKTHCLQCHQEKGKGVGKFIPPIDADFMQKNKERLGCIVKYGMNENITVDGTNYWDHMPGNRKMTDFDIVNLLNYINEINGDGNKEAFNIDQLRLNLQKCNQSPYYPTE